MARMTFRTLFAILLCPSLSFADTAAPAPAAAAGESVSVPAAWAAGPVSGDPLFFVRKDGAPAATGTLLRIPTRMPVLKSATLETSYTEGTDYTWQPGTREVTLTAGSRIPFTEAAALHPAPESPHSYRACRDGKSWMLFGEGRYFHDLQCVASYPSGETWQGTVPAAAPADQLQAIRKRLRAAEPVKLVTLGDSISTGANASGPVGAPPGQPGYPDLVAAGLERRYHSTVTAKNLSVGGMDAVWGLQQVPAVLAEAPDLVLLAFGMNDASGRRTPEEYTRLIRETRDQILTARPDCGIVLISPMTANSEWSYSAPDLYPAYATALKTLTGPQCAMADVTATWTAVLERKPYLSLSGNGLNHPNDFGHRLYADVILTVIGD